VFGILAFTAACNKERESSVLTAAEGQKPTQEQEESVMLMALHHNRDEVLAHTTSIVDSSWEKSLDGMRNWDCSLAIIAKHNEKYPGSKWELEGIQRRDRIWGPPRGERLIAANACAERTIRDAQHTIDLNGAFEKR
jgi:hypothetical protein